MLGFDFQCFHLCSLLVGKTREETNEEKKAVSVRGKVGREGTREG